MKYTFGDIVVVEGDFIGVIVKSWATSLKGKPPYHEVYVRSWNVIKDYSEDEIERYLVRHKYLSEEEKEYQSNAVNGF